MRGWVSGGVSVEVWNRRIRERIPGADVEPGAIGLRRWSWSRKVDGEGFAVELVDVPEIAVPLDRLRASAEILCAAAEAGGEVRIGGRIIAPASLVGEFPAMWDAERTAQLWVEIRGGQTHGLAVVAIPELDGPDDILLFAAAYAIDRRTGLPVGQQLAIRGVRYRIEAHGDRQRLVPM